MYNQGHFLAAKLALQGGNLPLKKLSPDILYRLANYSDELPDWQTYDDESAIVILAEISREALKKSRVNVATFCLISAAHYIADKLCLAHAEIEKLSTEKFKSVPPVEFKKRKRADGVTVDDRIFLNVEKPLLHPEIWDELPGSVHNYLERLCLKHSSEFGCESPVPFDIYSSKDQPFFKVYEQAIHNSRLLTLKLLIPDQKGNWQFVNEENLINILRQELFLITEVCRGFLEKACFTEEKLFNPKREFYQATLKCWPIVSLLDEIDTLPDEKVLEYVLSMPSRQGKSRPEYIATDLAEAVSNYTSLVSEKSKTR